MVLKTRWQSGPWHLHWSLANYAWLCKIKWHWRGQQIDMLAASLWHLSMTARIFKKWSHDMVFSCFLPCWSTLLKHGLKCPTSLNKSHLSGNTWNRYGDAALCSTICRNWISLVSGELRTASYKLEIVFIRIKLCAVTMSGRFFTSLIRDL